VLKALSVPQAVIDAIEVCWQGYLAMPPTTLGDTLLLADELAPVESPLRDLDGTPREGMAASIDMLYRRGDAERNHAVSRPTTSVR
jgi:hypothetical protein